MENSGSFCAGYKENLRDQRSELRQKSDGGAATKVYQHPFSNSFYIY